VDKSEKLVETYLKSCGFSDVRFEPDGNRPPDFLGSVDKLDSQIT
jgi:hypothetical protein